MQVVLISESARGSTFKISARRDILALASTDQAGEDAATTGGMLCSCLTATRDDGECWSCSLSCLSLGWTTFVCVCTGAHLLGTLGDMKRR